MGLTTPTGTISYFGKIFTRTDKVHSGGLPKNNIQITEALIASGHIKTAAECSFVTSVIPVPHEKNKCSETRQLQILTILHAEAFERFDPLVEYPERFYWWN